MQNISNADLALVLGGAGTTPLQCTTDNPTGAAPQQFMSAGNSGPSMNDRVMNGTNTMMSRGMSMLNDGRPSMPDQW